MSVYMHTTSQLREMSLREPQTNEYEDDDFEYGYEDDANGNDGHIVELTISCR